MVHMIKKTQDNLDLSNITEDRRSLNLCMCPGKARVKKKTINKTIT